MSASLSFAAIKVGFAQVGAESAWRTANTKSVKDEAEKRGIDLKFVDAQQKQENQIKAVRSFIAQKVDVIVLAPVVEAGFCGLSPHPPSFFSLPCRTDFPSRCCS